MKKQMNNYSDYESFLAEIVSVISHTRNRSISEIKSSKTNKILGKSNIKHQIDVSFIDEYNGERFLVLCECKWYSKKKIGLDLIRNLLATQIDIQGMVQNEFKVVSRLITLTEPTKPAKRFAECYGISIDLLTDNSKDFTYTYEGHTVVGLNVIMTQNPIRITS